MDPLDTYRGKRDAARTPEPVPAQGPLPDGGDDTFVVQEHHARRLHYDFRLERGGVLVSWAVPKGIPDDPKTNHLAVHTEDHPLDYASFEGEIPKGEYGGGQVTIWDRGTYETEKWSDREVMVVLHGERVEGRYVLFRTDGKNWMIHRMSPAGPMPESPPDVVPAERDRLPRQQRRYAFEFAWGGRRLLLFADHGGGPQTWDPEAAKWRAEDHGLRGLAKAAAAHRLILDGELVELPGRPGPAKIYMIFDLLHLDGRSLIAEPYAERRRLLDELELAGPRWQTAPWFEGDGDAVQRAAADQGLPGIVAKRLDAPYDPASADWRLIPAAGRQ